VLGLLADNNVLGQVEALVQIMQSESWTDFWADLGLALKRFDDVGLTPAASDKEIWVACQAQQLILITDNRNNDSADSLEATIRQHNQPHSLPVFTIAHVKKVLASRAYAERVVESLYDYLLRIDDVRGAGRLYIPSP
jgi:hypothetical protein